MILKALTISLIETAIYYSLQEGEIFGWLRILIANLCDRLRLPILKKPLFECNICMGGIYTLLIYPPLYGLNWEILPTMLITIGCNTLIAAVLKYLNE